MVAAGAVGAILFCPPIVHMNSTQITVFGKDYLWVCVGLGFSRDIDCVCASRVRVRLVLG